MTIEEMKNVDVRTVDPETLVDVKTITIDTSLPKEERIKDYIRKVLVAIKRRILAYIDEEEMRKSGLDESDLDVVIWDVKKMMGAEKKAWMKLYD